MKKPETTSKAVASIAGRILKQLSQVDAMLDPSVRPMMIAAISRYGRFPLISVSELKELAASALTQAQDNPKRKNPARKGKR